MIDKISSGPSFIFKMQYGTLFLNHIQHYHGRCLFILNTHQESFHDLDEKIFIGFNNEVKMIGTVLNDIFKPDLINYALLGNHIQHVHWHLIPRYKNDSNWGNPPWPYPKTKSIEDNECLKIVKKNVDKSIQNG